LTFSPGASFRKQRIFIEIGGGNLIKLDAVVVVVDDDDSSEVSGKNGTDGCFTLKSEEDANLCPISSRSCRHCIDPLHAAS
jgi:hypothetical protein